MTDARYDGSANDPRAVAAIAMIGRTGARSVALRYQDDTKPTVWIAVAEWAINRHGNPSRAKKARAHRANVGASLTPLGALLDLLNKTLDGGTCTHCGKTTGVTDHWQSSMPLADVICWYQWDPELETYRRGCEAS